jgi:putative transposase
MKCPAKVYQPSARPYTGSPDIDYPLGEKTSHPSRPHLSRQEKLNFSRAFAGQAVG